IYTLLLAALFINKLHWDTDDRVALSALIAILLAALLYAWRVRNLTGRQAGTLLVMLLLLELGNDSGYAFADRDDEGRQADLHKTRDNSDIAAYLHSQPDVFRVEKQTEALSKNWAEYHNLDTIEAMGASVTSNVFNTEWHTWQTRLLYGARFTIGEKPPLADSKEVFTSASGLKLYFNPGAWPRAWSVHEIIPIHNAGEGRLLVQDHLSDLRSKAFSMEQIPALTACPAADDVSVSKYAAESVAVRANMGCDGMVVLSDTYFPGWRAKVDGQSARIYQVDNCVRGVLVPRGNHTLTMAYRPLSVYLGAGLTALGVAASLLLAFFASKREVSY
ncbi:MAG: YfhO family protein, partial [Terriglobales bacterium]